MPEGLVHVASGKVRELFTIDDGASAARRQRPHLHVRRRAADRDPGQGPRPDRTVRLLVRAHRGAVPEPPARAANGRPLDGVPAAGDAAARVHRPRVSRRLGVEGLPATADRPRGARCRTGCASRTGCPSRSSRRRRRPSTGHDENIDAEQAAALVGADRLRRGGANRARPLPLRVRARGVAGDPDRRHQVRVRARRRREARARRRGVHAGLVALLARRRVPAGRARSPRSTSSSSATTARRSAGTRRRRGPQLPAEVVAGTRGRYVEAFERLTGIAFDDYLADPRVVLR